MKKKPAMKKKNTIEFFKKIFDQKILKKLSCNLIQKLHILA